MKILKRRPKVGRVFEWDIAEIMTRPSGDVGDRWNSDVKHMRQRWLACLEDKRTDEHYPEIVESLQRWGFVRPLTAYFNEDDGMLWFGDGHHRLAAAIDMGLTTVPVEVFDECAISYDSGMWSLREGKPKKKISYY